MPPGPIVLRCDGDATIGAGHVGRCVRIGAALRAAGAGVLVVGTHDGLAADLLAASGLPSAPPAPGAPAGVAGPAALALVDSYEIAPAELEALDAGLPVAVICDGGAPPRVSAVIDYHPHAPCGGDDGDGDGGRLTLRGPEYAPADPALPAARRARGFETALVTVGATAPARRLVDAAAGALTAAGVREVFTGVERGGLAERIAWADVAVSAGGSTAYDLACAGVPAVLLAIAANQVPLVEAFARRGVAAGVDARGETPPIAAAVARLADAETRTAMAQAGPRLVDGKGAARIAAALAQRFLA